MGAKKGQIGSSFDDFLKDEGNLEETTALSIKRVLAWQLAQAMQEEKMSKNRMAKAMNTSRSQLDRVLDPTCDRVQLDTLANAARALGRRLRVELD